MRKNSLTHGICFLIISKCASQKYVEYSLPCVNLDRSSLFLTGSTEPIVTEQCRYKQIYATSKLYCKNVLQTRFLDFINVDMAHSY